MVINHSGGQNAWSKMPERILTAPTAIITYGHKDDPQTQVPGRIIAGDSVNRNRWNKVEGSDYLHYSYSHIKIEQAR